MPHSVPHAVRSCQPHSVHFVGYGVAMEKATQSGFVWTKVRSLMKARGVDADSMSVDKLQAHLGIGRGSVQRITEGHDNLRASTMAQLAKTFQVPASEFAAPADGAEQSQRQADLITFDADVIEALASADNEKINAVRVAVRIALGLPVVPPKKSPPPGRDDLRKSANG